MPPSQTDEGIRLAAELRASHPGTGVVVQSQYAEPAYPIALVDADARGRGYLLKERVAELDQLIDAIHLVGAGGQAGSGWRSKRGSPGESGPGVPARVRTQQL